MNRRNLLKSLLLAPLAPLVGKIGFSPVRIPLDQPLVGVPGMWEMNARQLARHGLKRIKHPVLVGRSAIPEGFIDLICRLEEDTSGSFHALGRMT
jgi:hypothetical protein